MKTLDGRVAVITGGASGIGLAVARRCAGEGMKLVLADIERPVLQRAEAELASRTEVLAVPTDVADADQVKNLAQRAVERFGAVHLVHANAGVGSRGLPISELPLTDFGWLWGVNLFGVLHTIHAFLPHLIAADEAHLVTTASIAALIHPPQMGPYNASKAAVLALTETLHHELAQSAPHVGVSVLCPGWVRTNLGSAERNRPEALAWTMNADQAAVVAERRKFIAEVFAKGGIDPDQVADLMVDAVKARRFHIFTHPDMHAEVDARFARISAGADPEPPVL